MSGDCAHGCHPLARPTRKGRRPAAARWSGQRPDPRQQGRGRGGRAGRVPRELDVAPAADRLGLTSGADARDCRHCLQIAAQGGPRHREPALRRHRRRGAFDRRGACGARHLDRRRRPQPHDRAADRRAGTACRRSCPPLPTGHAGGHLASGRRSWVDRAGHRRARGPSDPVTRQRTRPPWTGALSKLLPASPALGA